jgi:putative transposase
VSDQTIYNWHRQHLIAARRRITELETERSIRRRTAGVVRRRGALKRHFEAIAVMAAGKGLPVQLASWILRVSESGYYHWRDRPTSARSLRHAWLTEIITAVHSASRGVHGAKSKA